MIAFLKRRWHGLTFLRLPLLWLWRGCFDWGAAWVCVLFAVGFYPRKLAERGEVGA